MKPINAKMATTLATFNATHGRTQKPGSAPTGEAWPPKYESKHEKLEEIPKHCFEKLLTAVDQDMDRKISLEELTEFVQRSQLREFSDDLVKTMFKEVTERRPVVHKTQLNNPISLEELITCCILLLYIPHRQRTLPMESRKTKICGNLSCPL